MRLIDADDLKEWECEKCEYEDKDDTCQECCGTMQRIDEMPTIEAEPIRHGHWVGKGEVFCEAWTCSVCGSERGKPNSSNYCPNCGAKMDEVEE